MKDSTYRIDNNIDRENVIMTIFHLSNEVVNRIDIGFPF